MNIRLKNIIDTGKHWKQPPTENMYDLARVALVAGIVAGIVGMVALASADPVPAARAVKAIIGEAENQGRVGMEAVACGIRNRGTLRGVYGEKAPRVKQRLYSANIASAAAAAWARSADVGYCAALIGGADHWENVTAFGVPTWAAGMVRTARIKDHVFYKKSRTKGGE